jgi:hypothetical protein
MPKSDLAEETKNDVEQTGPVDLLIGIAGAVNKDELQQYLQNMNADWSATAQSPHVVVAYPGSSELESGEAETLAGAAGVNAPRVLQYSLPAGDPTTLPWTITSAAQKAICSLAVELDAKVCVLLHSDLAMLTPEKLRMLTSPVLEKACDLVVPVYPSRKFEGLLNHSILAPIARALYGQRVRYPLAPDLSCSARMCAKLSETENTRERGESSLLWPTTQAALNGYQVCQVNIDVQHATQTEGLELSTVLSSLAGSAYTEMETYAPYWQRVRGSHPTAVSGNAAQQISEGEPVDAKPLIDSFLLGSHNLQEVWGLVLPPVTLLELKKLARSSPEAFRMPDELWVRIVYDFALAHRLRTMNRGHLMGALTPLYLGWVASYAQEVAGLSPFAAEQRFEQLARSYEEGKPYLVSRWRWPDRFNP